MPDIALLLGSLRGGGAERIMLTLANGFAASGRRVDLVVTQRVGPLRDQVPENVNLVDLGASRVLGATLPLVRYLRAHRPPVLLSALDHVNVMALWARRLARVHTRVFVSVHSARSIASRESAQRREALLPWLIRRTYPHAAGVIAVSHGVADDLSVLCDLNRSDITVIHNPIISDALIRAAAEPCEHPWLNDDSVPVILSAGRLTRQKDFPTLIEAFRSLRTRRPCRLVILGEGEERETLERMARTLDVAEDVSMPGFAPNPYPYMARASLFTLSSAWEGFGNVLVEAMACGCPVVSTDCPAGPAEILDSGKYGILVPPSNPAALAKAMLKTLDTPLAASTLRQRADEFSIDTGLARYTDALFSAASASQRSATPPVRSANV